MSSKVTQLIKKRLGKRETPILSHAECEEILSQLTAAKSLTQASWNIYQKYAKVDGKKLINELLRMLNPPRVGLSFDQRPKMIFRVGVLRKLFKDPPGSEDILTPELERKYEIREPQLPSIKELCEGLEVDLVKLKSQLKEYDMSTIARLLGSNPIYSDHLILGGRIALLDSIINSFQSFEDYLEYYSKNLNKTVSDYIKHNIEILDQLVWQNINKIYNTNYFAVTTTTDMYLLKADFNLPNRENILQMYIRVAVQHWYTDKREIDSNGNVIPPTFQYDPNDLAIMDLTDPFEGVNEVTNLLPPVITEPIKIPIYFVASMKLITKMTYFLLHKIFTPATPSLINGGTEDNQMLSCFMLEIEDNLDSIAYTGWADSSIIGKYDGGLGIWVNKLRHSSIRRRYESEGVVPMLKVTFDSVQYIKRSQGKRGAMNAYLEPWHLDVMEFLELNDRDTGPCKDAHITLWMPWIFYDRLATPGSTWTLFCPKYVTELDDLYGTEFSEMYEFLERDASIPDRYKRVIDPRVLFRKIATTKLKMGEPYVMDGDACNIKSNYRHLGKIRGSNLCTEIVEYADKNEIPSCNLASLALPAFVKGPVRIIDEDKLIPLYNVDMKNSQSGLQDNLLDVFDFELLGVATQELVYNLNSVIDNNWYPLDQRDETGKITKIGKIHLPNIKYRPTGIGMNGFADALGKLDLPYDHQITERLNRLITYCKYFNGIYASIQEAINYKPCEGFVGSPLSEGKFQFDLWAEETKIRGINQFRTFADDIPLEPSEWGQKPLILTLKDGSKYVIEPTWDALRIAVKRFGVANIVLFAEMPTATTAQYLGNSEAMEPYQSNLFTREVVIGEFIVLPRYLASDLKSIGLWNEYVYYFLQINEGRITGLYEFLIKIQDLISMEVQFMHNKIKWLERKYLTVWEISQDTVMRYASQRGRGTCQAQSLNIHKYNPSEEEIITLDLRASRYGLKNHNYYFRALPEATTTKFTVPPWFVQLIKERNIPTCEPYKVIPRKKQAKPVCIGCS